MRQAELRHLSVVPSFPAQGENRLMSLTLATADLPGAPSRMGRPALVLTGLGAGGFTEKNKLEPLAEYDAADPAGRGGPHTHAGRERSRR